MRRIVARTPVPTKQGVWEAQTTIPWVDKPGDSVQYGPDASHGPPTAQVTLYPPNDPEHPWYGDEEYGPTIDVELLDSIVKTARAAS